MQEGHQVEYFIALVTGSRTTWRPSVASHDISPDPSFSSRLSIRETLQLHVQAAGGTLAHLELRGEIMIDADPRLKARRDLARKLWPDEDPDSRFPVRSPGGGNPAEANRNMMRMYSGLELLWNALEDRERNYLFRYDHVFVHRDDAYFLNDFKLDLLLRQGPASVYVLACDMRDPSGESETLPSEVNDFAQYMTRSAAEIVGRYFSHLFDQSPPCAVQGSREWWRTKHKHKLDLMRPCMSEELFKWKLDASNVTVVRVGQRMLPFQRSLRVRTTENIEVCLHKYCQSKTQKMPGKGLQLCTSKYIQKELRRKESELWKTCAANEVREESHPEKMLQKSDESMGQQRRYSLGKTEIVLAHCNKSIEWVGDAVRELREAGAQVTHVHIVSKCGSTPTTASLGGLADLVVNMTTRRNLGRNDETFARFLVDRYESLPASLFFLKCSSSEQIGVLQSDLNISIGKWLASSLATSSVGFACLVPQAGLYHMAAEADAFSIESHLTLHEQNLASTNYTDGFKAGWRSLGSFTRHVLSQGTLQHLDAVQHTVRRVCYGGSFAASGRNVKRIPRSDWLALNTALRRGDNIEEGHFAERLWAALLSPPVDAPTGSAALSYAQGHYLSFITQSGLQNLSRKCLRGSSLALCADRNRMSYTMPGLITRCKNQNGV